ncbi:transposase [Plantibacter sp. H53]|uniref:transposase n=1 Tax=Plantibacter sp. H53 TaxID=1827323 RepID=UPI000B235271|nr:transposase [Plantibacter sp. H53]
MPLTQRFTAGQVKRIVADYEAGDSATSIAREHGVAPSALLRFLRQQHAVIRQSGVTDKHAQRLISEHAAGATLAELERRHHLSHGAVFRALHRFD